MATLSSKRGAEEVAALNSNPVEEVQAPEKYKRLKKLGEGSYDVVVLGLWPYTYFCDSSF